MGFLKLGPIEEDSFPKNEATVFGLAGSAMAFQAGKFTYLAPDFINEKRVGFRRCRLLICSIGSLSLTVQKQNQEPTNHEKTITRKRAIATPESSPNGDAWGN